MDLMIDLSMVFAVALPLFATALVSIRPRTVAVVIPAAIGGLAGAVGALAAAAAVPADAARGVMLGEGTRFAIGLTNDRVGAIIAVLTLAVGLVVLATGTRAFEGDVRATRFSSLGAALIGAVALTALGATLLTVAIGWFAAGAALTGLLRLGGTAPAARDAVRRTVITLSVGDAALAAGLVTALATVGSVDLRGTAGAAAVEGADVAGVPLAGFLAVVLVVAGIARSALVPAHRWLPSTVAAPTPVSALLHAGVVNGVGVLVLRTAPVTTGSSVAMALLGAAGAVSAILATGVMLARADAKGTLAWSTAGQMGFMAVQLAVGALASALFHLIGHAMYKASLFLGVGATVRSHADHRHLPQPGPSMGRIPRAVIAATVPAASIAAALALFSPDLSPTAAILVVGFGWWTAVRLVDGWLADSDRRLAGVAVGIGIVAPIAYVGAMSLFKGFVGSSLPDDVSGAVPAAVLLGVLGAMAAMGVAVCLLPAGLRASLTGRAAAALIAVGTPPVGRTARRRPVPAGEARPAADPAPISLVPAPFHT